MSQPLESFPLEKTDLFLKFSRWPVLHSKWGFQFDSFQIQNVLQNESWRGRHLSEPIFCIAELQVQFLAVSRFFISVSGPQKRSVLEHTISSVIHPKICGNFG